MNKRDTITVLLLLSVGILLIERSIAYDIGTLKNMGPGFFPFAIGVAIISIGLGMLRVIFSKMGANASYEKKKEQSFERRPLIGVMLGILSFGVVLPNLGLVPAVFLTSVICSLTDKDSKIVQTLLFSVLLSIFCWVLFVLGLELNVSAFNF